MFLARGPQMQVILQDENQFSNYDFESKLFSDSFSSNFWDSPTGVSSCQVGFVDFTLLNTLECRKEPCTYYQTVTRFCVGLPHSQRFLEGLCQGKYIKTHTDNDLGWFRYGFSGGFMPTIFHNFLCLSIWHCDFQVHMN